MVLKFPNYYYRQYEQSLIIRDIGRFAEERGLFKISLFLAKIQEIDIYTMKFVNNEDLVKSNPNGILKPHPLITYMYRH